MFDALLHRLGVSRAVKLLESARLTVPAVVGWLRPAILLPVGALSGLTPSQLEAVLAHELAHVRRYDYLVGLLQALLETLLFYHPAVWWVSGRIRQESEYCCDDIALGACPDRRNYAEALAKVVELHLAMPHLAPAATAGQVVPRIRRILGLPAAGSPAGHRWLSAFLALICLSTTALIIHNGSARAQAPKAPAASAI
jgi:beta-lactamase regulating signal transducer with metallopeptidase domain